MQGFLWGFSSSLGRRREEVTASQRWGQVVRTGPVCQGDSWQQTVQFWGEIPFLLAAVQGVLQVTGAVCWHPPACVSLLGSWGGSPGDALYRQV